MALEAGTKLGLYEILEPIGAGGMGEVYRARDTKLGREVAIKVLPEAFAQNEERLARFEREARLLASLNHPNIATLYGFEQSDGIQFLVMELADGETLTERLRRGPLPVEDALPIFKQIAEALEAAHEKGIIHRDLKPANVKVTPRGRVKLLDFGLAKAYSDDASPSELTESPTVTRGTAAGIILGTAAYMSPEQARGKEIDKRTDIWAFGCCLYEALTGKAAFLADTVSDTIVKILTREPPWDGLPASTPQRVRRLIRRCLAKDPVNRFRDIADVRFEMEDEVLDSAAGLPEGEARTRRGPWIAAVLAALAFGFVLTRAFDRAPSEVPAAHLSVVLAPDQQVTSRSGLASPLAVSPDGKKIVFSGQISGGQQLFLRALGDLEPRPLPGTEEAEFPFFSPDGEWIGFLATERLRKLSLSGGAPITIARLEMRGATWADEDTIILGSLDTGLWRVAADGGQPEPITKLDREQGEFNHRWPQVLPDGKAVLFVIATREENLIALLDLETKEKRVLLRAGLDAAVPHYLRTGHIVFARSGELLAVPFDPSRREVRGSPTPVISGIYTSSRGIPYYAVSPVGVLCYAPGAVADELRTLVWVDRDGNETPIVQGQIYEVPRLSPDGQRVAATVHSDTGSHDIWIFDVDRGTRTRVTTGGNNIQPFWTPDGERLTFVSSRTGPMDLYWTPSDGTGEGEPLFAKDGSQFSGSWSPDGQSLVFEELHPETGFDLWQLSLDGDRTARPFLTTPSDETGADVSPDGRWLAYVSDESGRDEIYVQRYPGLGDKIPISNDGGFTPQWSRDGRALFYRNGDQMLVVDVAYEGDRVVPSKPRLLFRKRFDPGPSRDRANYDVAPVGERFLMVQSEELGASPSQLNIVLNWFEELNRLVPTN